MTKIMSYLDDYNLAFHNTALPSTPLFNAQSSTPVNILTNYFKSNLQAIVNSRFEDCSNYYVVSHKNTITGIWTDVGVRLDKPYDMKNMFAIKDDYFKVTFKNFDYGVSLGDMFEFGNHMWMVIDTGNINTTTTSVFIQRCNTVLKFTETSATPLHTHSIVVYGISSRYIMNSLNSTQFITLPDNQVEVSMPNDANSRKIKYTSKGGTRFLMGSPYKNFKTISIDSVTKSRPTVDGGYDNGIIMLKLELAQINPKDDLINGIAWQDYW